jgi:hypothetical protein
MPLPNRLSDAHKAYPSAPPQALLEFFYAGEVSVPEALITHVLETAHFLKADEAMQGALATVRERLSVANCLDTLGVARKLSVADLAVAAEALVVSNFDQVRTHPSFGRVVGEETMLAMLADDALNVSHEESAFEAATGWLTAQKKPPGAEKVAQFLRLIRYPTMSRSFVTGKVLTHPLVRLLPNAREIVLEAYMDAHYGPLSERSRPRLGVVPPPPSGFTMGAPPPAPSPARRKSRSMSRSPSRRKSLRGGASSFAPAVQ